MPLVEDLAALPIELTDKELIAAVEARGFIVAPPDTPSVREIDLSGRPTGSVKFGVVGDTHLGSIWQQLTHLTDFYENWARPFGVDFMLNGGDLVDGTNMHKDQQYQIHRHGAVQQGQYVHDHYPQIAVRGKTVKTLAIGGNHDFSFYKDAGANFFDSVKRKDIEYLGSPIATFHWGPITIRMMHPDGGPAYARSYKPQKIVEGFPGDTKPHFLTLHHWHVQDYVFTRNVHALTVPCFQAQTAYMARKGLEPVVGGYLVECKYNERGPLSVSTQLVTYPRHIHRDW